MSAVCLKISFDVKCMYIICIILGKHIHTCVMFCSFKLEVDYCS